jgi:hypothetical protein
MSVTDLNYDPSVGDNHTTTYQRAHKNMFFIPRIEGILAHDTSQDEQGLGQCGIDIIHDVVFKVKYPAGANIKFLKIVDNSNTFTNQALISQKPTSQQTSYDL